MDRVIRCEGKTMTIWLAMSYAGRSARLTRNRPVAADGADREPEGAVVAGCVRRERDCARWQGPACCWCVIAICRAGNCRAAGWRAASRPPKRSFANCKRKWGWRKRRAGIHRALHAQGGARHECDRALSRTNVQIDFQPNMEIVAVQFADPASAAARHGSQEHCGALPNW